MTLRSERGQAVPFVAALVVLAVVLTLAVARFAGNLVDAARARTAADAAALAAVLGGPEAAERLAAEHHGTLVQWSRVGRDVLVTVRIGRAVVTARATGGDAADGDGR
jgi:hypothetical protein